MDPKNAARILAGEQFIGPVPQRHREGMARRRITQLVKTADGSGHFQVIDDPKDVIKLAGRAGSFDLSAEYGVPEKLVEALDLTTQLAMAAGLDALREAGIPLVQTWKKTTTGKYLPERWMLPEAMREETGVVFASAFPGFNRFADEAQRYYTYESRRAQKRQLEELLETVRESGTRSEISRRIAELDVLLEKEPYEFDRRFLLRILTMGHSQFAEYIGARGPNTHVNVACASTASGIALAEDWIRAGRCRRVVVVAADNVTSDALIEWIGAGFIASGAGATDERVEDAALPFDRRRHGTLIGMGACALVVESQDAVEERGMRGIVELLSAETRNSAFHATRLDVEHVASVVESLVASAERRFGVRREAMAPKTVFVSHETYTPARGGSAAAEIMALREVFGDDANRIIVANTKGFTGHPMGVGIEDVIGVKILEHQIVPPVPNLKEPDPDLGNLTLSKGGRYDVEYAIHLAAGFGSQIALTLTRRIPGPLDRVDDRAGPRSVAGRRERPPDGGDRGGEARAAREVDRRPGPRARRRARGASAGRCGAAARVRDAGRSRGRPGGGLPLSVPRDFGQTGPEDCPNRADPSSPGPIEAPQDDKASPVVRKVLRDRRREDRLPAGDARHGPRPRGRSRRRHREAGRGLRRRAGGLRHRAPGEPQAPRLPDACARGAVRLRLPARPEAARQRPRHRPRSFRGTAGGTGPEEIRRRRTADSSSPVRTEAPRNDKVSPVVKKVLRSWPRRPATRRTCWRWTSTSRPTSASTR